MEELRLGSYLISFIIKEKALNSDEFINKIIIKDLLGFVLEEFKIEINNIFDLLTIVKYFFEYSAMSSVELVSTMKDKVIFTCLLVEEDCIRIIFDKYNVYQDTVKAKYIIDLTEEEFCNFGDTIEFVFLELTGKIEEW